MWRRSPFADVRLDAYTVTGVVGWGLSAWVAATLGMALGGLDGAWLAGGLVYLVLVREWRVSDRGERVLQDLVVTVLAMVLIPAGFRLLRDVSPRLPSLLVPYLPVVTVGGALNRRRSSSGRAALS